MHFADARALVREQSCALNVRPRYVAHTFSVREPRRVCPHANSHAIFFSSSYAYANSRSAAHSCTHMRTRECDHYYAALHAMQSNLRARCTQFFSCVCVWGGGADNAHRIHRPAGANADKYAHTHVEPGHAAHEECAHIFVGLCRARSDARYPPT